MADSFLPSLQNMPSWDEYKTFALKTQANNNAWSAQQAQKQMDFQAQMSNTAHQREVADLKAAGLNPVLSAGGSGASVTSGAAGQTDTSVLQSITSYLMQQNQNLVNLEGQRISAETAMETAKMHAQAQMAAAATAAAASRYAADKNYELQIELASKYPHNFYGTLSAILNGENYNLSGLKKNAINAISNVLGISPNALNSKVNAAFAGMTAYTKTGNLLGSASLASIMNRGKIANAAEYHSILNYMRGNNSYYRNGSYTFRTKSYNSMDALERLVYDYLNPRNTR